ncbi:MFS transporter [Nesterenkonia sp. F]|uniref:MFS transporter n=1 Tax=Nesterenkonia sp. F TaxID=795955 RepID=UPI000255C883|nr:MFS transporter [Nesterenkonia sp. F]
MSGAVVQTEARSARRDVPATPLHAAATARLAGSGLAIIAVTYGLARFAYGLFVPAFRAEFDLDAAQVGAIGSASYAAYCAAIYPAMMLAPRLGGRTVALTAGICATLGLLLIGLAPTSVVLAVGVVLGGLSTGLISPAMAHAVSARVAASRRDRTQVVVNAGTGLGVALSGPAALLALEQWRAAWLVFALLAAAATAWVVRDVPEGRAGGSAPAGLAVGASPARRTVERLAGLLPRPLLPAGAPRLLITAAVVGATTSAVWVFGRDVLTQVGGQGEVTTTLAWSLLGLCGLLGAGVEDLARRIGVGHAWAGTALVLGAATAVLGLRPDSALLACLATAIFGVGYIAMTGLLLVTGARVYPRQPSAGVGLAFLALAAGQTVGGAALGAITEAADARTAFVAAAGCALLSALLVPRVPGASPDREEPPGRPA